MGRTNTQVPSAPEVAVANAETATIVANADVDTTANANADVDANDTNVITGVIKSFNFTPAKESKTGRSQNIAHIAIEGEEDETTLWLYDSQIENALSLKDLVALCDVCDIRERRKNVLFREAEITLHYETNEDGYENAVIDSITLSRASKAAALSGINLPHYLVQVGLIDRPELDVSGAYYICPQREPDGSYYICTNREIDISYCICPYRESALRAD